MNKLIVRIIGATAIDNDIDTVVMFVKGVMESTHEYLVDESHIKIDGNDVLVEINDKSIIDKLVESGIRIRGKNYKCALEDTIPTVDFESESDLFKALNIEHTKMSMFIDAMTAEIYNVGNDKIFRLQKLPNYKSSDRDTINNFKNQAMQTYKHHDYAEVNGFGPRVYDCKFVSIGKKFMGYYILMEKLTDTLGNVINTLKKRDSIDNIVLLDYIKNIDNSNKYSNFKNLDAELLTNIYSVIHLALNFIYYIFTNYNFFHADTIAKNIMYKMENNKFSLLYIDFDGCHIIGNDYGTPETHGYFALNYMFDIFTVSFKLDSAESRAMYDSMKDDIYYRSKFEISPNRFLPSRNASIYDRLTNKIEDKRITTNQWYDAIDYYTRANRTTNAVVRKSGGKITIYTDIGFIFVLDQENVNRYVTGLSIQDNNAYIMPLYELSIIQKKLFETKFPSTSDKIGGNYSRYLRNKQRYIALKNMHN